MDYWTAVMVTLSLSSLTGIDLVFLQYCLKILCGHCSDSGVCWKLNPHMVLT